MLRPLLYLFVALAIAAPAPAFAAWAIVLGDTGGAYVTRDTDRGTAMRKSMEACQASNITGCQVVAKGLSGCAAIAGTGKRMAAAGAGKAVRANAAALAACTALHAGKCTIIHQFCGN